MADGLYSIGDILNKALDGVEFKNEPTELSDRDKRKQEKWKQQQEEKERRAKQMQAEMEAATEARKQKAQAELKKHLDEKHASYTDTGIASYSKIKAELDSCKKREDREYIRERELQAWIRFIDSLTDSNRCCPDEYISIHTERFIRSFSDNKKFLFSQGMPLRPSFLLRDKEDPKTMYTAWTGITPNTIQLEFGSQIPSRHLPNGDREIIGTEKRRYFSVRYWDAELEKMVSSIFIYERYECEFEGMLHKLNEFFGKITTASKKRYQNLKWALDKKAPGLFNHGRTEESIQKILNDFLRTGGTSANITEQNLKHGDVVVFSKNNANQDTYKYILVNSSHFKSCVIDPTACIAEGVSGFGTDPKTGKIFTYLAYHMELIEIDMSNRKITIVHGA